MRLKVGDTTIVTSKTFEKKQVSKESENVFNTLTLVMILCNELTKTKWKVEGEEEAKQT